MKLDGMVVHHAGSIYDIYIAKGTMVGNGILVTEDIPVMRVTFGKNGDSMIEAQKIKIFIRHLKEAYNIRKSGN